MSRIDLMDVAAAGGENNVRIMFEWVFVIFCFGDVPDYTINQAEPSLAVQSVD